MKLTVQIKDKYVSKRVGGYVVNRSNSFVTLLKD